MLAGDEETSRWLEQAIETFQTMLHTTNPYIRYMRSAVDLNPGRDLKILLKHDKGSIPRVSTTEAGIFLPLGMGRWQLSSLGRMCRQRRGILWYTCELTRAAVTSR